MGARLVPIPGEPALLLEPSRRAVPRSVIVSDLHLGLGAGPGRAAGPLESSGRVLAEDLLRVARDARADAVVIAGDAKHPIVGTPPALRPVLFDFFSHLLADDFAVELVPGNHDVGIVPHLPREVAIHPPEGFVRDEVGIFHGHRWPSEGVLHARRLVAGHLHPGYRLAPTAADPEGKRRCWVRVQVAASAADGRRSRRSRRPSAEEIVVIPAFNPVAGIEALNRDRPARGRTFLYGRFLSLGRARAYLLDGTDLGVLPIPGPGAPSTRSRAGARTAR